MTVDEWTDADPSGLPETWRDVDSHPCDRCPDEAEHVVRHAGEETALCDKCYRHHVERAK